MNRIEEIKKRKPFALWDLIVYGILAAVILALFAAFVFGGSGEAASGIQIVLTENETVVYTYSYGTGGKIAEGWETRVEEKTEDGTVLVTVYLDGEKTEFNTVAIDVENRTAVMRDANCSFRKDCTHSAAIASERSVPIICLPHRLKVCALGADSEDIWQPSIG